MRSRVVIGVWLVVFIAWSSSAAQRGADGPAGDEGRLGTWAGTWDGAGTGGFELVLERSAEGVIVGRVAVTGEPAYKANFRTLTLEGNTIRASYDFPPDEAAEVVLAGSFESASAAGSWTLREKASGNAVISGGWTVTKK